MLKRALKAAYSAVPAKRPIFELLRPLKLPKSVYQHLHFSGPFTVYMDGMPMFRMNAGHEVLENELFWAGLGETWEAMSTRLWCRLAIGAAGILDIGANTGAYSLLARAVNPSASVIAFEPVKRIAKRLRQNIALNNYAIETVELAASDKCGTAPFFDVDAPLGYAASLEEAHGQHDHSYPVDTITIDEFLAQRGWPRVDLVKIDVETHEPAVFRGMRETIARFQPAILVEVLHLEQGQEIAEMASGYLKFNIDEEGRKIIPTDTLRHIHGASWNNLLCTETHLSAIKTLLS
jgi:FkbM family methyltransferase